MARLSIRLLGPFQVGLDAKPVTHFESDKVRALLAYLALEADRPHRRESLAGLLWPEFSERSARTNLRAALADLRQAIEDREVQPAFLQISRQALQFNGASDAWVDARVFEQGIQAAGASRGAADGLETVIALYRGGFLEGFSLPDSPAFEEWVLLTRERFHRLALEALRQLAAGYEARAAYGAALRHARHVLDLDPLLESAHRQVMRLLACSGERAAALAQFEVCREMLRQELDVAPAPETQRLFERIRAGEWEQARPSDGVVDWRATHGAAVTLGPSQRLPLPLRPLVGRLAELEEIRNRLNDPDCRLLTLLGPGGIGKTRLALQIARELAEGGGPFRHGVFMVPLASVETVEALIATIANAMGLSFSGGANVQLQHEERELKTRLLDCLQGKAMLLVLDNFEQLLAGPKTGNRGGEDLLLEMLRDAPGLKLLVTSREGLNLRSEWRFVLEGLEYPLCDGLDGVRPARRLTDYGAVELFTRCAQRVRPGFTLAREGDVVVHVCRLVEGMPLAIEMAATWLKVLPASAVAERLQGGLDLLTSSWRDAPPRHRSMRAAFEQSWRLLSEREQGVLRGLAVFRGSFELAAAAAVAGASLADLAGLVEKSLLRAGVAGHYQMHELLRQYALEKLGEDVQQAARTSERHSAYYAGWVQVQGEVLKGPDQRAALARLDQASDNVQAAWDWAAQGAQVALLDQALEGLCLFFHRRLRHQEGEAACRIAREHLEGSVTAPAVRLRARLQAWEASFCLPQRATRAQALLASSLCLLERPELTGKDTRRERALALEHASQVHIGGDWERAWRCLEESVVLYGALGDEWRVAKSLGRLGWLGSYVGRLDESINAFQKSLALLRRLDDRSGIAEACRGLGAVVGLCDRTDETVQLQREALALWRELDQRWGIAGALSQLGASLVLLGDLDEGVSMLQESREIWEDLGIRSGGFSWAEFWLGFGDLHRGMYESARVRGEVVLALAREVGDAEYTARSSWLLGNAALAEDADAEAEWLLAGSVAAWREYGGLAHELSFALADLGLALGRLGQMNAAWQALHDALEIAVDMRSIFSFRILLPPVSLLLAELGQSDRGRLEQALEFYALACRYPLVEKSQWYAHVVGRHIAALTASLPGGVMAAAQERGRARDWWPTAEALLQDWPGLG